MKSCLSWIIHRLNSSVDPQNFLLKGERAAKYPTLFQLTRFSSEREFIAIWFHVQLHQKCRAPLLCEVLNYSPAILIHCLVVVVSSPNTHAVFRFGNMSMRQWIFMFWSQKNFWIQRLFGLEWVAGVLKERERERDESEWLIYILCGCFSQLCLPIIPSIDFSPGTIVREFMWHKSIVQPTTNSCSCFVC